MRTRAFFLLLLLAGCGGLGMAQTAPDFSGVYIQEQAESHGTAAASTEALDPIVLVIRQDAGEMRVTQIQNGAEATQTYNLSGKAATNTGPDGAHSQDRVKFKHGRFVVRSEWKGPLYSRSGLVTEQSWYLVPDRRTLTIRPGKVQLGTRPWGFRRAATFRRQSSLQEALAKAQAASSMNRCNATPWLVLKGDSALTSKGLVLGYTGFEQLDREVNFDANLSGDFFKSLKRKVTPTRVEYLEDGQAIQSYAGSLVLEVGFRAIGGSPDWSLPIPNGMNPQGANPPEWLLTMRFHVRWVGPEERDLGEIPSELKQEPWPELRPPQRWYRLEVPAQGVPLTDSLEVHILSADGKQLGCISGHL